MIFRMGLVFLLAALFGCVGKQPERTRILRPSTSTELESSIGPTAGVTAKSSSVAGKDIILSDRRVVSGSVELKTSVDSIIDVSAKSSSVTGEDMILSDGRVVSGSAELKTSVDSIIDVSAKSSSVTGEDMILSDGRVVPGSVIGKGTHVHDRYMAQVLNDIKKLVRQTHKEYPDPHRWSFLCEDWKESDCMMDTQHLNPEKTAKIIRLFGIFIKLDTPAPEEFYLQGWAQHRGDREREVLQQIWNPELNTVIVNYHIEKFPIVNSRIFTELYKRMKQTAVDLHIVGRCSDYCANFLVPLARTVYIEPYGYIVYNEGYSGWADRLAEIYSTAVTETDKILKEMYFPKSGDRLDGLMNLLKTGHYRSAMRVYLNQAKNGPALNKKVQEEHGVKSFMDLPEEEKQAQLSLLPESVLDGIYESFLNSSPSVLMASRVHSQMEQKAALEKDRLKGLALDSIEERFYFDWIKLPGLLIPLPVPYRFSSDETVHAGIVPEAETLRRMGMDIQGENDRMKTAWSLNGRSETILYMDYEDVENCGFFSEGLQKKGLLSCLLKVEEFAPSSAGNSVNGRGNPADSSTSNQLTSYFFRLAGLLGVSSFSELHPEYVVFIFNEIHQGLLSQDEVFLSTFSFLCPDKRNGSGEKDCSKGVKKPDRLIRDDIILALYRAGQVISSLISYPKDPNKVERVMILHGNRREDLIFSELEKEDPVPINRIIVNLPGNDSLNQIPFFSRLGEIIKRRKISLYISGVCSGLCSMYLIPQAKEIYLEPYGLLGWNGLAVAGSFIRVNELLETHDKIARKKFFSETGDTALFAFLFDPVKVFTAGASRGLSALSGFYDLLEQQSALNPWEISEKERSRYLEDLDPEILAGIRERIFLAEDQVTRPLAKIQIMKSIAVEQSRYFEENSSLKSRKPWSYFDLTVFSSYMRRDGISEVLPLLSEEDYKEVFGDSDYRLTLPSTEVLRQTGLNIYGVRSKDNILVDTTVIGKVFFMDYEDVNDSEEFPSVVKKWRNLRDRSDKK